MRFKSFLAIGVTLSATALYVQATAVEVGINNNNNNNKTNNNNNNNNNGTNWVP